jgi:prepilin-type N-terminal cleavage/methylation domain-containing protein
MKRNGFTLIELLVVISIIATLMGLAMPIVSIAGRASRKTATRSVMVKVEIAARLFRADMGPYPYQASYADLAAGDSWTNRLYYQLGTNIAPNDYDNVLADADAVAALYADVGSSIHAYTSGDTNNWKGSAAIANRMASERVRLAIFSGNTAITGAVLPVPYRYTRRVLPTGPLLATPASAGKPGWAKDYLNGEIEKRYISDEAILDAWKKPILYVCQVVEGMNSAPMVNADTDTAYNLNAIDVGLQPLGRISLADIDTITGNPLTSEPTYLPDLTNRKHSDRRFYAAPGYEIEFELWSAGPDGRAEWMRDASVNTDNVSLLPYDRNIP